MDISFLQSTKREIKNMNKGKVGAPFEYSGTYIQFLAFLKIGFKISYRTVQGIIRGLSDYIRIEEIYFTFGSSVNYVTKVEDAISYLAYVSVIPCHLRSLVGL